MPVTLDILLIRLKDLRHKPPAVARPAEGASILKFKISYIAFDSLLVEKRI